MFLLISFFRQFFSSLRQVVRLGVARQAAAQGEADHHHYLLFQQKREADRARIYQQIAEEHTSFLQALAANQRTREARRRLVPSIELARLLLSQNRISQAEYELFFFDTTGEYCPTLLLLL